jgi:uncharacterized protein YprB with RNaseH-like and TPR domain
VLTNTFIHVAGVGIKTEARLWDAGVTDWNCVSVGNPVLVGSKRNSLLFRTIEESKIRLDDGDAAYFSRLLPTHQSWRLFPEFRDNIAYLDIETTGLDRFWDSITAVTLYDGKEIQSYVQGRNLDDFPQAIRRYKVLVTYNGKTFDVPFIERFFSMQLNQAHIDLRYVLGSLGLKGGLKACEARLGIDRGELTEINGFWAVLLWHEYQSRGRQSALDTLLAYNVQDTVTLETLLVLAHNLAIQATPFHTTHRLDLPETPKNPFRADCSVIERIRSVHGYLPSKSY